MQPMETIEAARWIREHSRITHNRPRVAAPLLRGHPLNSVGTDGHSGIQKREMAGIRSASKQRRGDRCQRWNFDANLGAFAFLAADVHLELVAVEQAQSRVHIA